MIERTFAVIGKWAICLAITWMIGAFCKDDAKEKGKEEDRYTEYFMIGAYTTGMIIIALILFIYSDIFS